MTEHWGRRHWSVWVAAAALVAAVPATSPAESGTVLMMPAAAPQDGLQLRLDTRWPVGSGYHPVRISLAIEPASNGPAISDRTIQISIRPEGANSRDLCRATRQLVIPEGQLRADAVVLIPQAEVWTRLNVTAEENGVELKELTGSLVLQAANQTELSEGRPAVLCISSLAPRLEQRAEVIAQWTADSRRSSALPWPQGFTQLVASNNRSPAIPGMRNPLARDHPTDLSVLSSLGNDKRAGLLHPEDLPVNWLAYTGLDIVAVSLTEIKQLGAAYPRQAEALRRWLNCGGNLIVFDASMTKRLKDIDTLLAPQETTTQWAPIPSNIVQLRLLVTAGSQNRSTGPSEPEPMWSRPQQLGQVIALEANESLDLTPIRRVRALNLVADLNASGGSSRPRWAWYLRTGVSMFRDSSDYRQYLIPGVGQPPLLIFLACITLFVVLIGPVNYVLLRRARRLYLLLVTVPAGAALVTVAMLFFVVFADGLGVRALVRSYAELDQRSGEMVCWARQTYYAGTTPSQGMTFSDDTAVLPIQDPEQDVRRDLYEQPRELVWTDDQRQNLRQNFLRARTPTQFVVIRSGTTQAALQVTPGPQPQVVNQLGAKIEFLLLADGNGALFEGRSIDVGQTANLSSTSAGPAVGTLRSIAVERQAVTPLVNYYSRRYKWYNRQVDRGLPQPAFSTGLMEQALSRFAAPPAPGTYIVVLNEAPLSELGIRCRLEPGGLNVIKGTWQ